MSEEKKPIDVNKLLKNKLKDLTVGELEKVISESVSNLIGEDYKCTIDEVKYTLFSGADFHIKLELSYNKED